MGKKIKNTWIIKFQKENIKYSLAEEFKSKEDAEDFINKIVVDPEFYTPTKNLISN